MKSILAFITIVALSLSVSFADVSRGFAQSRDFHTQRIVLDDDSGHTTTIQTTNATGSTFTVPSNTPNPGDVITSGTGGGVTWAAPSGGTIPSGAIVVLANNISMPGFTLTGTALIGGTWMTEGTTGFTARSYLASAVVNSKIYAMGGFNNSGETNILEVYDPAANTWSTPATTGTFTARGQLTAATVNGKIYTMGGLNGNGYMNTFEMFDPSTNVWSTPSTTGTFTARADLTSSVVNNKIYTFGGSMNYVQYSNVVEVFDPSTNAWSTPATSGTFTGRFGMTSSAVNGKIYVIGGFVGAPCYCLSNLLEVFDPSTNAWSTPTSTNSMTARGDLTSSVLNGQIYALGGTLNSGSASYLTEVYDPVANGWTSPALVVQLTARTGLTSQVAGGKLCAIGGGFSTSSGGGPPTITYLNTNEALQPPTVFYYFTKN
jgi:hypothetical protein